MPIYVYSSGSKRAQDLHFAHTFDGDLRPLFRGFFDTTSGPKTDAGSYRCICEAIGVAPGHLLFLSDLSAELDAAAAAGLQTTWLVRPGDATADPAQRALARHPVAVSFAEIAWPGTD